MALNEGRTLSIVAKMTDQFTRPLSKMERSLTTFGVVAKRAFGAAVIGFGAIATASVIGFRAMLRVSEGLDKIAKASDNLGITAESLTAIRNAAELADVSMDPLGAAMKSFSKLVDEANQGGRKQIETLERLGLNAKDFQDGQTDVVKVLAAVADGMQNVGSAAARTRLLLDLFGKSGTQMGALLKGGGDAIRRMAEEARKLGVVFSREELQRVEDMNDAWRALGQTFRGIAERVTVDLAPAFAEFFGGLKEALTSNSNAISKTMLSFVATVVDGLSLISAALNTVMKAVELWRLFSNALTDAGIVMMQVKETIAGNRKELEIWQIAQRENNKRWDEMVANLLRLQQAGEVSTEAFKKLREQIEQIARVGTLPPVFATEPEKEPDPTIWEKYWGGFKTGAEEAKNAWQDFAKEGERAGKALVDGGLGELTDGLASFIDRTKTANQATKEFLNSMLSLLAKVIAKLIVMESLNFALGLEKGGVVTDEMARGGIKRYAGGGLNRNGGIARRPTVLFGEGRQDEAFVPLPDNRSIPVTLTGASGTTINYTFHITAMDGKDVQRVLIENQTTLRAIWQNQVETRIGMRQVIQRAG